MGKEKGRKRNKENERPGKDGSGKAERGSKTATKTVQVSDTDKVYDAVFWSAINLLKRYIPDLVREAFGEKFPADVDIRLEPNKQMVNKNSGGFIERNVDMLFRLIRKNENGLGKAFHYEVETYGKKEVVIRIAQYGMAHAATYIYGDEGTAEVEIPYSAVIFLRSDSDDIKELTININYPGGRASYKVPVLRIKDYTLESLFEKRLLILVPFYVFSITEKEYDDIVSDRSDSNRLKDMLDDLCRRLQELVDAKELSSYERMYIKRFTLEVLNKLLEGRMNVKKGEIDDMGGYIIKTEFDDLVEELKKQEKELEEKDNAIAEKDKEIMEMGDKLKKLEETLKKMNIAIQ